MSGIVPKISSLGSGSATFDDMARAYELYVPWESRLAREIPFLARKLGEKGVRRVLDAACGPGRHAVALAKLGFEVTAVDVSPEMIALARRHAEGEGVAVDFVEGKLEDLPALVRGPVDAVLCLGNSLAALESFEAVEPAVRSFGSVLKPGGLAITQTVDFAVVAPEALNPTPLRRVVFEGAEYFFVKSFVRADDRVFIHFVTFRRMGDEVTSDVRLHAMNVVEPSYLLDLFAAAAFDPIEALGDYGGSGFAPGRSRDLIILATITGDLTVGVKRVQ